MPSTVKIVIRLCIMTISIVTRFGGLLDIQKTRFNIDLYTVVWRS